MEPLIFYTTLGCHLCEQGIELVDQVLADNAFNNRFEFLEQDIAEDDQLIERYGVRIPVLRRPEQDSELGWPFDINNLAVFLK